MPNGKCGLFFYRKDTRYQKAADIKKQCCILETLMIWYQLFGFSKNIRRCVGIGRRGRLKICLWQRSVGSSPTTGIIDKRTRWKSRKSLRFPAFFYIGFYIGLGCQKAVFSFLIGNLHKAGSILFRCTKIRKSKSAWVGPWWSDVYVLNAPSMGR